MTDKLTGVALVTVTLVFGLYIGVAKIKNGIVYWILKLNYA